MKTTSNFDTLNYTQVLPLEVPHYFMHIHHFNTVSRPQKPVSRLHQVMEI